MELSPGAQQRVFGAHTRTWNHPLGNRHGGSLNPDGLGWPNLISSLQRPKPNASSTSAPPPTQTKQKGRRPVSTPPTVPQPRRAFPQRAPPRSPAAASLLPSAAPPAIFQRARNPSLEPSPQRCAGGEWPWSSLSTTGRSCARSLRGRKPS
jgi:hypothetical protein